METAPFPTKQAVSGATFRGAPAGASPNAAAARRLLKPLPRAFYPSLPEPRRRIDLALWAVVIVVGHYGKRPPIKGWPSGGRQA